MICMLNFPRLFTFTHFIYLLTVCNGVAGMSCFALPCLYIILSVRDVSATDEFLVRIIIEMQTTITLMVARSYCIVQPDCVPVSCLQLFTFCYFEICPLVSHPSDRPMLLRTGGYDSSVIDYEWLPKEQAVQFDPRGKALPHMVIHDFQLSDCSNETSSESATYTHPDTGDVARRGVPLLTLSKLTLPFDDHIHIKTTEQPTIIQQYGDWHTGR